MEIRPANLIPDVQLKNRDYQQLSKKTIKILTVYSLVFLMLTSAVLAMYYYLDANRDMDVPPKIRQEYMAAIAGSEALKNKNELMQRAKKEDGDVTMTMTDILAALPPDIKLTRISISDKVQLEGFSPDPAAGNKYVAQLNTQGTLKAAVERVSSSHGVNTFVIKAERVKQGGTL